MWQWCHTHTHKIRTKFNNIDLFFAFLLYVVAVKRRMETSVTVMDIIAIIGTPIYMEYTLLLHTIILFYRII